MSKISPNDPCPCNSGRKYKKCCRPYHGGRAAPTPEALMRSRFSAYATANAVYIMQTTHPDSEHHMQDKKRWQARLGAFMLNEFVDLDIVAAEDDWVEFKSYIRQAGETHEIGERSVFKQVDGRWLYFSSDDSAEDETDSPTNDE